MVCPGDDPDEPFDDEKPSRASTAAQPQVVVVDDDAGARNHLRRLLRRAGLRVRTLSNPWEALALCARSAPPVLVVDVRMPQMDGRVLVEELHRRMGASAPRVIFVSSLVGEIDLPQLPLVVEAFPKMPAREVLVQAVQRYVRGHSHSCRIPKVTPDEPVDD